MVFDDLIARFLKFPGVGPRQAKRFAHFVASADKDFARELADLVNRVRAEVGACDNCFRLFAKGHEGQGACLICTSESRDKKILMVVEKDADLETIEFSGAYDGRYFVLGGTLPMTTNGRNRSASFRREALMKLIQRRGREMEEIIFATSATLEGAYTAKVLEEEVIGPLIVKRFPHLKITRLGRGLSTGSELEYSDRETIAAALENRR